MGPEPLAVQLAEAYPAAKPKPRRKYLNVKREAWGIKFDSLTELRRYGDLRLLQSAGRISGLKPHPKFELHDLAGKVVATYTADSEYIENGVRVIEDTKSKATQTTSFRLKARLLQAEHGITVRIYERPWKRRGRGQ